MYMTVGCLKKVAVKDDKDFEARCVVRHLPEPDT